MFRAEQVIGSCSQTLKARALFFDILIDRLGLHLPFTDRKIAAIDEDNLCISRDVLDDVDKSVRTYGLTVMLFVE